MGIRISYRFLECEDGMFQKHLQPIWLIEHCLSFYAQKILYISEGSNDQYVLVWSYLSEIQMVIFRW